MSFAPFRRIAIAGALAVAFMAVTGCAHNPPDVYGVSGAAVSPDKPWAPPPRLTRPQANPPAAGLPEDLLEMSQALTLLDIVDIALRNSPQTAQTWAQALSAGAAYGSQKGAYYPQISASSKVTRSENALGSSLSSNQNRSQDSLGSSGNSYSLHTYQGDVNLSWLLFDFGGREGGVDEKRQALIAADFTHNAEIQNVILAVEQAYFQYVASKALFTAQETTVKEARTNLDAAEERHRAGLATIADVLQARTSLAQAQLVLDRLEGRIQTTRGALATAMGLPANVPYDVGPPSIPKIDATTEAVEKFLADAQTQRPDLAAARAEVEKASANLQKVKAEGYPTITGNAQAGRTYYDRQDTYANTYSLGLQVQVPIFTGFSHRYNVLQARADEKAAKARLLALSQTVTLEVWSSYYNLRTARQQVKTSEELLRSATESQDVALGRYKAGVGSILDLLATQSALGSARALRVQAYVDWATALAQLAHDTGALTLTAQHQALAAPVSVEKDIKP